MSIVIRKTLTKFCVILTFTSSQLFAPFVYADKYMDNAKAYVEASNENLRLEASFAVASQFAVLSSSLFSKYSPEIIDANLLTLDQSMLQIYNSIAEVSQTIHDSQLGQLDLQSSQVKIQKLISDITTFSNQLQRFSWLVRDQIDLFNGANDWLYQSILAFQGRCELGYLNPLLQADYELIESPPGFKADFNVFFNFSSSFGGSENADNQSVTNSEVSLHSENYVNKDIENLQNAGRVVNQVGAFTGGLAIATAVNGGTALGVSAGTLGLASAAIFGAGAVLAIAVFVIGSYQAYKAQKRWANGEMYKFRNLLDSDDFSMIYRSECSRFSENLQFIVKAYEKYSTDSAYKQKIDQEVSSITYGECRYIIDSDRSEPGDVSDYKLTDREIAEKTQYENKTTEAKPLLAKDIIPPFDEENAEKILKYYMCTTKVHGPKLLRDLVSDKISISKSRLDIMREYLTDLILITSDLKSDLPLMIQISDEEIKIDRLYKNFVVSSTGLILGLISVEDYQYQKNELEISLSEAKNLYSIKTEEIVDGIRKVEQHVDKYIKMFN